MTRHRILPPNQLSFLVGRVGKPEAEVVARLKKLSPEQLIVFKKALRDDLHSPNEHKDMLITSYLAVERK